MLMESTPTTFKYFDCDLPDYDTVYPTAQLHAVEL
jgi:hypothetical protein